MSDNKVRCDICKREMNYCFYIDDKYWIKANKGVPNGIQCAHCTLEATGGLDWYITQCEPIKKVRKNLYENELDK